MINFCTHIFWIWTKCRVNRVKVYITGAHCLKYIKFFLLYFDCLFDCTVQYGAIWLAPAFWEYNAVSVLKTLLSINGWHLAHVSYTCDYFLQFRVLKALLIHVHISFDFIRGSNLLNTLDINGNSNCWRESCKICWEGKFIFPFLQF